MQFINRLDEKQRFVGLKTELNGPTGQINTHGLSYMGLRKMFQEAGKIMGFDKYDTKIYTNNKKPTE